MTSDRSVSGDAEMQLSNTPVTPPKSAGLNPNANVFQSKGATTPPEPTSTGGSNSSSDWQENTDQDQLNNVVAPEGYTFVNGDVSSLPAAGVTFPPTPESPSTMQITATSTPDYTSLNGAPIPNEVLFSGSEAGDENTGILGNIPDDQLRDMLKNQLEYYFSRENLANDSYLVSQMDADQYVPISTVAGFNQVKRMTTNMDLVIEVLRESPNVQVDESGEKVRPLHKRCVVILREVPDTTPIEDVEKLFSGDNCPRFVSCEFAHNNSWYITFDSDEDAQKAYQYLREEVQTFLGKPIMARIKAKPLLRSTFIPKNGYKAGMAPTGPGQASPAVVTQTVTTPTPTFSPTDNQFAAAQRQYTFTQAVPNVPQTTQFIVGQPQPQQQTGAQQQPTPTVTSYPFFPPNNVSAAAAAVMHSWPGNPMPYFDPGTAFAANGYTHAATYKMGTQSRHGFQNMRNRNQTKPHTARQNSGPERQTSQEGAPSSRSHHDVRSASSHDRHQPVSSVSRSSSRGSDIGHSIPVSRRDRGSSSSVDQTHSSVTSSGGGGGVSHNTPYSSATTVHSHASPATVATSSAGGAAVAAGESSHPGTTSLTSSASQSASSRQPLMAGGESSLKDQNSQQPPRRSNYRSRRRRDDDGAKTSSRGSTQASARDTKPSLESPKFDLEATSFPPLPGSTNSTTTGDVFENKMSDVVKGTAKPSTSKPTQSSTATMSKEATPPPSATPANSTSTSASQSQSQPKVQQSTQSTATTTVAKATSAAVMATSTSNSSTSQPTAAAVVASSSKGKSASSTNTVTSLPTPPPTPPSQPSKPVASSVSNKKQPEREKEVTSTPDQAPSVAKQEKEPAPSAAGIPKLTYAQMLQRKAAMNEAAANGLATGEPSKESDGNSNPPANGSSAPVMNGLPPSSGSSTNTTSSSSKPAALREQSQTSRALGPPSRSSESFRKDDNGYKDQRMGFFRGDARRAKENRDRRDFRDRDFRDRGFRDRDTDRYRRDSDRYRDDRRREYDSVRTSSK